MTLAAPVAAAPCSGATALDKRSAKAYKAAMLARLGAAADKRPRMPAKIGLGIMKKAKQREAVALQEAIAAGMVKAKGRGKKERAQKGGGLCLVLYTVFLWCSCILGCRLSQAGQAGVGLSSLLGEHWPCIPGHRGIQEAEDTEIGVGYSWGRWLTL